MKLRAAFKSRPPALLHEALAKPREPRKTQGIYAPIGREYAWAAAEAWKGENTSAPVQQDPPFPRPLVRCPTGVRLLETLDGQRERLPVALPGD